MKGSIQKRGSKWSFVIDIGRDEHGKRIQKRFSGFNTKKEAEKALAEKITEIEKGVFVNPTSELVKDYMEDWLKAKRLQVRPSTIRTYTWIVNHHIIPAFGPMKLTMIKPQHINKLYLSMRENGLSDQTILHVHRVLKEALKNAVDWGLLQRNVAESVKSPRPMKEEMKIWNSDDVSSFLEVAKNDRLYTLFYLAIVTGMRQGEILGLRWQDIDFQKMNITIVQTYSKGEKEYDFQQPKSRKSKRTIALDPQTIDILKIHKAMQNKEKLSAGKLYQDIGLVFATKFGKPLSPRNVTRKWHQLQDKAEVQKIRFHDLRHTHASILLKQGVHPKVVSERLGHSSINTTLDIYSHVLPGLQEQAAAQFIESITKKPM